MCRFFNVSRSGYYDYVKRMEQPDRDLPLAEQIKECQQEVKRTYGYRRVQIWLERKGIHHNPKTVLRVMQKYNLLSVVRRKKYQKYGECLHRYPNLLNRDFHADRPNQKWLRIYHISRQNKVFCTYLSSVIFMIIALLLSRPALIKIFISFWVRSEKRRERKRSQQSCSSTVTKAFNTHRKHFPAWFNHTALRRQCQDVETHMTMLWLKIFSLFSKQSVFTGLNRAPMRRLASS